MNAFGACRICADIYLFIHSIRYSFDLFQMQECSIGWPVPSLMAGTSISVTIVCIQCDRAKHHYRKLYYSVGLPYIPYEPTNHHFFFSSSFFCPLAAFLARWSVAIPTHAIPKFVLQFRLVECTALLLLVLSLKFRITFWKVLCNVVSYIMFCHCLVLVYERSDQMTTCKYLRFENGIYGTP